VHAKDPIDIEVEYIMEHMTSHRNDFESGDPHNIRVSLDDAKREAGYLVDLSIDSASGGAAPR
jgi:hypothetical protein